MQPVDLGVSDGSKPGGILDWVEKLKEMDVVHNKKGKYDEWLILKFSNIKKGSRLTEQRTAELMVGEGLTSQERRCFLKCCTTGRRPWCLISCIVGRSVQKSHCPKSSRQSTIRHGRFLDSQSLKRFDLLS